MAGNSDSAPSRAPWWKLWAPRIIAVGVLVLIARVMLKPLILQWRHIQPELGRIHWGMFAIACGMFALSQFAVRVNAWRWVLRDMGYHLAVRPAGRIWVVGELARFIPGLVWQVLGRAWLARPYGIPMHVTSVSHILEVIIYLLANVIVATLCLPWLARGMDASGRHILIAAACLLPLLAAILYPPFFFAGINLLLKRLRQPPLQRRLRERMLVFLLLWATSWQVWLALAVWLVVGPILKLPLSHLPLLAGACCLAWTAGFCLAWLTPSGLGVREFVLGAALWVALPPGQREALSPEARTALFIAIALLVRLWATCGEGIYVVIALLCDLPGLRSSLARSVVPSSLSPPPPATPS
jgi:hypothetical protein